MSKTLNALAAGLVASTIGFAGASANAETITETLSAAGNFNTFLSAAQASGVDYLLALDGPFTVFAPTDEAFAALPAGTLEELMLPENRYELADILKYHILPRALTTEDMIGSVQDYLTFEGSFLEVNYQPNAGLFVGNENALVTPDVAADNGVIHIIDAVLLP
ncbi:MAG: fasciclin domain-containing protein [Rhodospirillaceae bacterium]|nr:fasciclin domain-containing protein [Rhodospirillaceae bacterium]